MIGGTDPKIRDLVPSDIEIRGNHMWKNPRWKSPALPTPSRGWMSTRMLGASLAGS